MKISQLIEILNNKKEEVGDLEVFIPSFSGYEEMTENDIYCEHITARENKVLLIC